jgi:hypothetical protein
MVNSYFFQNNGGRDMKKRYRYKILSFVLAFVLAIGSVPQIMFAEGMEVELQTGALDSSKVILGTDSETPTVVLFGGKEWVVIGFNGVGVASSYGTMTLLLKNGSVGGIYGLQPFSPSNNYSGSTLQVTMDNIVNNLPVGEKNSIIPQNLVGGSGNYTSEGYNENNIAGPDTTAYFWPLSMYEVEQIKRGVLGYSNYWWLRSPGSQNNFAALVRTDGTASQSGYGGSQAVRPAFTLNLDSILFTSTAANGKTGIVGQLHKVKEPQGATKLTVIDDSGHLELDAVTLANTTLKSGESVNISYYIQSTEASNEYLSCILLDQNGNTQYYGKLSKLTPGLNNYFGNSNLVLPQDISEGDYTLRLFREQINVDYYSDFAGEPVNIDFTINNTPDTIPEADPLAYNVTFQALGEKGTVLATADGEELVSGQAVEEGKTVVFTARPNQGYSVKAWRLNGVVADSNQTDTFMIADLDAPAEVTAEFEPASIATYTAVLEICKDELAWSSHDKVFTLKNGSDDSINYIMTGDGSVMSAEVPEGEWKIYDGLEDTGRTINISGEDNSISLHYYTILYAAEDKGTALGSTIDGVYDGKVIKSGDVVLGGKMLALSAAGKGAVSYTYTWGGTAEGTTAAYTTLVNNAMNAVCTVTGVTEKAFVSEFTVKAQPSKLGYQEGEKLDLSGLRLSLTFSDFTAREIGYEEIPAYGILMNYTDGSPAVHGDVLTVSEHNGKAILFTLNGKSAQTEVLSINAVDLTEIINATAGEGGLVSPSGTVSVSKGDSKTFTIIPNSNYRISAVMVDGINIGTPDSYTFYNVTGTHTIHATFSKVNSVTKEKEAYIQEDVISSGNDTGKSDSEPVKRPNQPVTGIMKLKASVDKKDIAKAVISKQIATNAIIKAREEAITQGKTGDGIAITLDIDMPERAASLSLTLTQAALNTMKEAQVNSLSITGSPVLLSVDSDVLEAIQKQSTGNVTIAINPVKNNNLSANAKKTIGNRPIFNITVNAVKSGKTVKLSSFGIGKITVSIPYTSSNKETVGYLYGAIVDKNKKAVRVEHSFYDENSRSVILKTSHLSSFGIGYTKPEVTYTDTSGHWGKDSIDYLTSLKLFSGTSDTEFSPNQAISRKELATVLGKLANVKVNSFQNSSFRDVPSDASYAPYLEWAYKKGILHSIGNKSMAPEQEVTREEMAVILQNYAKTTGYTLPVTREVTIFSDSTKISSSYKTAVKNMQQAGIMAGGRDNRFAPKESVTRGEVSVLLHRYTKLMIDPSTSQGWNYNDEGERIFYQNGRLLTGWQTIDGKKYFFSDAGILQTQDNKTNR